MIEITNDIVPSIIAILFVLIWLILLEVVSRRGFISKSNARKILHIILGNILFFLPLFSDKLIATFIPFLFIPVNYLMSPLTPIKKLQMDTFEAGHSWGTILYAVSLTIVVWFGFDTPYLLIVSFFPLCFGDGFAALMGSNFSSGTFETISGKKSLLGSWSFIWATMVSIPTGLYIYKYMGLVDATNEIILVSGIIFAIIGVLIEMISPKGTDNFFIPVLSLIIASYGYNIIIELAFRLNLTVLFWGTIFAGLFAFIGIIGKFLTLDGALAGFFIGIVIMGIGGWTLGIALLSFFIVGSLATKLNKKGQKDISFEKGSSQRDSLQALAKAGFACFISFLTLIFPDNLLISIIVIGALGSSLADTMGTEIGILSKSTPRPILRPWKIAKKGESGAISAIGTFASLIVTFLFVTTLFFISIIDPSVKNFPVLFLLIVPIAAVIGMLLDSIFGVILQEQRSCQICNSTVETKIHCEHETTKLSGFSFINNDLVNFSATTLGGIIAGILYFYLA